MTKDNSDLYEALDDLLMRLRNQPSKKTGRTPAELMLGEIYGTD